MINSITIVGGGTAGWIAANLFAKQWPNKKISLIEAPDIPTVGVGEGSTPYIQKLFETLEIEEETWMAECNATFKNGITFSNWSSVPGCTSYFHPFFSEIDELHIPTFEHNCYLRRKGNDVITHPDNFFLLKKLTDQSKKPHSPKHFPFKNIYAYHFDAELLGKFLRKNAIKLGVKHIVAKVNTVETNVNGEIACVHTNTNKRYFADFFIDCTGFRALLINKTLNVPFISFADNLFNDSAVAIASPFDPMYKPQTVSTAMKAGWAWHIPLTNRVGNGYVYSSRYLSNEEAEQELRAKIGPSAKEMKARHLKMRVGRTKYHWYKNCLAVGLSQGFIEPLEATALHIVQDTIEQFIKAIDMAKNNSYEYQDHFNQSVTFGYESLRDYIVLHYLSNSRNDSQYWIDARNKINISASLNKIMQTWFSGGNLKEELINQQVEHFYSSMSWHAMLSGVGLFPKINTQHNKHTEITSITDIHRFLERAAMNYQLIRKI